MSDAASRLSSMHNIFVDEGVMQFSIPEFFSTGNIVPVMY